MLGLNIQVLPKTMENYVSAEVGCLRCLDSHRFHSSSLFKFFNSLDTFPIVDSSNFKYEILKLKIAYPYEYFDLNNFEEPLHLTAEDFFSILKQISPLDGDIYRTQENIKKYDT